MSSNVTTLLAELRKRFKKLYGERLFRMVLYGSQARGESDSGSDIDVLVVLQGVVSPGKEIERTGDIVSELSLQYNEVVSCVFISEDRYLKEGSPLLLNIRREGVLV